ncbi:hypothetical protein ACLOJK_036131 [Asimina triloba]
MGARNHLGNPVGPPKCGFQNNHVKRLYSVATYVFDGTPERNPPVVFDAVPERGPSFYNSTIVRLAKNERFQETLNLFCRANGLGIRPTKYAVSSVLNACSKVLNKDFGSQIHARIIRIGYEDNVVMNSAIVTMYAKCGAMAYARRVFDGMREHDEVSWTLMISELSQNGCVEEALELFKEMLQSEIRPNHFTLTSVISACSKLESAFGHGAYLHAHVIKLGFDDYSFVISSLIDYYAKLGEIPEATSAFDEAKEKDGVVYNAMIAGFSQNLLGEEALKLFMQMHQTEILPTCFTFSSLLNACGTLAVLQQGRQIHTFVAKMGLDLNVFIASSLVDMYSKCGSVDEARLVFNHTVERNSVLWTSMIVGYAQNGRPENGIELFELLVNEGVKPDKICFTGVLTACNHAGLLEKSLHYFNSMIKEHGLVPELDQYACIIDLYGRHGHLKKAKDLMDSMPLKPNSVMWSSFLGFCRIFGEVELGAEAASHLLEMEPFNSVRDVTLANMYAEAGMWKEVAEVRRMMRSRGVRKTAGCSWICVNNRVHVFSACDSSHPHSQDIYRELDKLVVEMSELGTLWGVDINEEIDMTACGNLCDFEMKENAP